MGQMTLDEEDIEHKLAESTFKPKSLKNTALLQKKFLSSSGSTAANSSSGSDEEEGPKAGPPSFQQVKLKPAVINYKVEEKATRQFSQDLLKKHK